MDKKVTIHDIAREAGVSAATVSYIINNRTDKSISEKTRQHVLHIINLYNYKPAAFAKNLRSTPDFKLIALFFWRKQECAVWRRIPILFKMSFTCVSRG